MKASRDMLRRNVLHTAMRAHKHALSHRHTHTRTAEAENEFNEIGFLHHFPLAGVRQTLARDSFYFRLSKFCVLRFSLHFHLELNRLKNTRSNGNGIYCDGPFGRLVRDSRMTDGASDYYYCFVHLLSGISDST